MISAVVNWVVFVNDDRGKAVARIESEFTDGSDRVGDVDGSKFLAEIESFFTDGADRVGDSCFVTTND